MDDVDERKPALQAQIERLCDKLGYELDRLDTVLYTGTRGRPRINPDVSDIEAQLKAQREDPSYWTPQAIDARAKAKKDESAKKLEEMLKMDVKAVSKQVAKEVVEQDELIRKANEELAARGGDNAEEHDADVAPTSAGSDQHD